MGMAIIISSIRLIFFTNLCENGGQYISYTIQLNSLYQRKSIYATTYHSNLWKTSTIGIQIK